MEKVKPKLVFMFSGQGSQFYHMGEQLFNNHPVFRHWMEKLDQIIVSELNVSLIDIIYSKNKSKADIFDRVLYTHPAIFMVEYSLAQTLIEEGFQPDYLMGTSLGEFTSIALAGVLPYTEVIQLLIKQAKLFEEFCEPGNMLAILTDPEIYYNDPILNQNSELVSVNFNEHFVISGKQEKIRLIINFLKQNQIIHQLIPVKYAFHSSSIKNIEEKYLTVLENCKNQKARIPIISCLNGNILSEIKQNYLWEVVYKQIMFREAFANCLQNKEDFVFIDLGPSSSLATFAKYNLPRDNKTQIFPIITQFSNELKCLQRVKEYLTRIIL